MEEIVKYHLQEELIYKDTVVLKYQITYPQLLHSRYRLGARRFNQYNYQKAVELKEYAENELFKEAQELYDYNSSNGYPIMVYEFILNFEVTFNENGILSLYTDEYLFSGGAHGNTKREAQNWNLRSGRMIALKDLFPQNPYYVMDILKEINRQIEQQMKNGENQYFENYCQLVQENLRFENFYLVKGGIIIFFNQYEIAPYSSGIPTFFIKNSSKN